MCFLFFFNTVLLLYYRFKKHTRFLGSFCVLSVFFFNTVLLLYYRFKKHTRFLGSFCVLSVFFLILYYYCIIDLKNTHVF